MKTDVILILNVLAMFLISACTDYWMYRSYDFPALRADLARRNDTAVGVPSDGRYSFLQIYTKPNGSAFLFTEFSNLYRDCSDLLEGYREELFRRKYLYRENCHSFIDGDEYHLFRKDGDIILTERVSFTLTILAGMVLVLAVALGTYSSVNRSLVGSRLTATALLLVGLLYLVGMSAFLVKVGLVAEALGRVGSRCWGPPSSALSALVRRHSRTMVGWSFVAGLVCVALCGVSAWLYWANGAALRERVKERQRRAKIQIALMSTCKQDIGLTLKKKIVLKNP